MPSGRHVRHGIHSYRAHVLIIWGSCKKGTWAGTWLLARCGNNTLRAVWDCALCILLVQPIVHHAQPACLRPCAIDKSLDKKSRQAKFKR